MSRTYEGMFLIDNDAVRAGWPRAKALVTGLVEKHGGTVRAARRWGERALAYPIQRRRRGTYLLAYYEIPGSSIPSLTRDLEISDSVLRYLLTKVEEVPAKELELALAEEAPDFVIPEPPADDSLVEERLAGAEDEEEEDLEPALAGVDDEERD